MADSPIKVKAYGKILNFPAGTTPEAIESALAEHEPTLNPEYKTPEPEALDYAKGFASGANKLVSGVGLLTELAGAKETGKAIRDFGDRGAKYWNDKMSKGGKIAAQSQVFVDDDNEDSVTGIKLSDDWGKALLMGAAQSTPSMFAAAIPGIGATKAIQALAKLGLAGGAGATIPLLAGTAAPVGVASNIIARAPAAVGFGAAEGVTAGAMNAAEFKSSIEAMPDEELNKSPVYRALKTEHGPETARSMLAEQASIDLFGKTALATGTIGALTGGGALGQAYQKATAGAKSGILGTMIKGSGAEALQEAPQSAGEQYLQNVATKEFLDPTKSASEGVATAAASGAAIGGLMGGVVGAGGAINLTPDRRAKELDEKRKIAEMKASAVNAQQQEQDMADIGAAQDIDQVVAAASKATSRPSVNANDVLRAEDPTLADIERLTGLKPIESIDTAIDEINNPQPQEELKNVDDKTTQQKTAAKTPVLERGETPTDVSISSLATGKTSASWVVREKQSGKVLFETFDKKKVDNLNTDKYEAVPAYKYLAELNSKISGSKPPEDLKNLKNPSPVGALTKDSPVLNAETFKASGAEGTHADYLRDHPNREQAAAIDANNVEDNLIKGLQKTGKFNVADSKTQAKPFAEFYRVNAERQGILPSELYARMPLNFSGKGSGKFDLKQKADRPFAKITEDFLKDSSKSDAIVQPGVLRLYHGTSQKNASSIEKQGEFKGHSFFTPDEKLAKRYSGQAGGRPRVISVLVDSNSVLPTGGYLSSRTNKLKLGEDGVYRSVEEAPKGDLKQSGKTPTIKVRGVDRPTVDSDNKPIPNPEKFHEWFGDSKVVDKEGRPLTVYHGTKKSFDNFEVGAEGKNSGTFGTWSAKRAGIFFAEDPTEASEFATQGEKKEGANILPVKLSIKKPADLRRGFEYDLELYDALAQAGVSERVMVNTYPADVWELFDEERGGEELVAAMRKAGYDGARIVEKNPDTEKDLGVWVAFNPTQIKSAIGNSGEFNSADPNILKQSKKATHDRTLIAQHNISVRGLLHADRMGGLAAPSLAIADKDKPLTGFGEITLISNPNLVDPKRGAKVFGSDIYSPRYPSITLIFSRNSVDRLNDKLKPFVEVLNSDPIGVYELNNAGSGREVTSNLKQDPAVLAAFLTEKGITPKYKGKPKREIAKELKPFTGATDAQTLVANPNFLKAAERLHKDFLDEKNSGDFTQSDKDRFLRNLAYDDAHRVVAYSTYLKGKGKIDPMASYGSMRVQIDNKKLGDELEVYIEGLVRSMHPEEKIFKGFTYSGSRRYSAHTLENIVNELKKNVRGAENFNYGLGTVRSKYTPQFKSLEQIRKEKGRLVSDEEFEVIKKDADDKFIKLGEELNQYHEAARFDTFAQAFYDAATMGIPRALRENGYKEVPAELMEEVREFLADLAHLPTEYFEVKLPRAVELSEFSAAVVPKHTPESVINILKKNGITNIKKYKDAEDRKKQIGSFDDLLFQSNFYSALEKEIPNLRKIANKNGEVSVEQAKAWINSRQKEGKFKQAEVEAVGLIDWLDTLEGKVPVADVEEFVQENGVQVEEVILEGDGEAEIDEDRAYDMARQNFSENYEGASSEVFDDAIADVAEEMLDNHDDGRWGDLVGLNDAEEVEAWLESEGVGDSKRDMVRVLEDRYQPDEILGEDTYNEIRNEQEQYDWENNQDYYLDRAREQLENESGGSSGGTEFGDYVLRGGGTEYKELLFTLPNSKAKFSAPHFDRAQKNGAENIFAHTRINERYVDVPMADEELAQKAAYDEWVRGNNAPEIKGLMDAKREASENYHRAIEMYREKIDSDKSIVGGERIRLLRDMYDGDNPPSELKPFIQKIDEIGAKVKAKQEERLAVKPKEPVRSGNKERVLFIEEIQSDWAQKGRDEGFAVLSAEERKELALLDEKAGELGNKRFKLLLEGDDAQEQRVAINLELLETNKRREELRDKVRGKVPTAPFVTDTKAWTGLVVKRLLRYAAENGFDRIAWTNGAQQAERYQLSKKVSEIQYDPERKILRVRDINDRKVIDETVEPGNIGNYIGNELADKLLKAPVNGPYHQLTGVEDLNIGGEGMREFYDRIVPSVVSDVSRKLSGGKVDIIQMGDSNNVRVSNGIVMYPDGKFLADPDTGKLTGELMKAYKFPDDAEARKYAQENGVEDPSEVGRQMSLQITPALRDKVMQGLPLFQQDRAGYNPNTFTISLMDGSDMSSVIHEGGHFYLEALEDMASRLDAPAQIVKDFDTTLDWFGVKKDDWKSMTLEQKRPHHEQWAQAFERYALEGVSPTEEMQPVFDRFKEWMLEVYKSLKEFLKNNPLAGRLNNDVRQVFDRLIASEADIQRTAETRGTLKQSGNKTSTPPTATPPTATPPATPKKPFDPNTDIPETKFRKAQRLSQDAFNRFTVVQEWLKDHGTTLSEKADVFQAEERYHSLVANQLEDFREQIRNPLIEKIEKAGFTLSDVADFLEAQHAEEANKAIQDVRSDPTATAYGITDADAKAYLVKADPKLKSLANELRDITEDSKQLRLKAGLISQDEVDAWEAAYDHYIPVKGDADVKSGTGKGLKVNFKTKRRLGHGKRDEAVIENILLDHERAIMQVEKNRVAKHLVMMAAEMNRPEIVSIGQPVKRNVLRNKTAYEVQVNGVTRSTFNNRQAADMFKQLLPSIDPSVKAGTVTINPTSDQRVIAMASPMLAENEINVYIDGHAIRVQINDDLLARAYSKLGVTGFSALVSAGRAFNGYLSKVYTGYNPEFIVTNMIRDFTSGLINLTGEEGGKIALKASKNYAKSFTSLMQYAISDGKKSDKWIDMYRANGGNTGAAYLSDLERLGDEIKTEYASYQGVLANLKSGDMANAARAAGRKAFNLTLRWIYNLNQAGENAMRLSAFRAMIESGKTQNEAAKVAKNITVNFNRKGEYGAEANAAYLFFNASVQGTAALAHAHFKGKHKFQAWGLSSMVGVLGYLAAMALIGDDEDDYDKINDYTKSRNFLIKAGDGYAQIPVPYGYGFFWNTGRAMAEAQHKGELGALPWHLAASAIEELTPFSDTVVGSQDGFQFDQVLLGLLPTVVKIPAQPAFNKQLFSGGELFPERASQQFQPDREKMWRSTQGTMYDKMAGWLSDTGLGDVSPETLKHHTRTATGGTGALVDATVSAAMLKKEGAELEPSEIPFVRKAYSKITIKEQRAAYYKAREEAKKTAEAFSRAKTRNDVTTIDKLVEDEAEMLGLDAYANNLSTAVDAIRDLQDAIRLDDSLNAAEKRVQIKALELSEGEFYDQFLDVFKTEKMKMKERKN